MAEERRENESKEKQQRQQNGGSTQREIARPSVMPLATPFTLMRRFMDDLDQLFSGLSGVSARAARDDAGTAMFSPVLETLERDGQFVVRADVPGVDKDHVHAEIENGRLVIWGERDHESSEERGAFYRTERSYGRFYRAIDLPEGVDADQASGTFANGVLQITMPITKPEAQRIEIQEAPAGAQQPASARTSAPAQALQ